MVSPGAIVAIDIGGTFTDLALLDEATGAVLTLKSPTTPDDPSRGAMTALRRGVSELGLEPRRVQRVIHATTLATNLVLESKGARVGYVTTHGFRDLLTIGKERRAGAERYDLSWVKPPPPVPPSRCVEVIERVGSRGEVLTELDDGSVQQALAALEAARVESIAVCLLHAYANPDHERRVRDLIRERMPAVYVALSSDVWPEFREYDRAMTTVLSAYVGPVMAKYVQRLEDRLSEFGAPGRLHVMQSSGGTMTAASAVAKPVATIESGPAAGVIAAAHLGRRLGYRDLISFDMGGTTTKASVVRDGMPSIRQDFYVGGKASAGTQAGAPGYPVKTPAVDLAEVGSGGGSIAWVDRGGVLQVGPQSAGAVPGPACYAKGGDLPTVTDADLVLGYLNPDNFVGGAMAIDPERSRRAIETSAAKPLGLGLVDAAQGIVDIANANMASAIRLVTVQRGIDPRHFTVVAFGGAGPVHAVEVARHFDIPAVVIPGHPGAASAVGLLISDVNLQASRTHLCGLDDADPSEINALFTELERQTRDELPMESSRAARLEMVREVDVRYQLQSHELSVRAPAGEITVESIRAIGRAFEELYEERYGLRQEAGVQFVAFRVRAVASSEASPLPEISPGDGSASPARVGSRLAHFRGRPVDTPVYARSVLRAGDICKGPALIEEPASTTVVPPGSSLEVDAYGNLLLSL